jgi:hypothetical protein
MKLTHSPRSDTTARKQSESRKLSQNLGDKTFAEVLVQPMTTLRQLALDLGLTKTLRDGTSENEIKGLLCVHFLGKGKSSLKEGESSPQEGFLEIKTMLQTLLDTQTTYRKDLDGISTKVTTMESSLNSLSGFVEDFGGELSNVKGTVAKTHTEGRAKFEEMEKEIKMLNSHRTKQDEAIKRLAEQWKQDQIQSNSLLARLTALETDSAERPPPPPPAVVPQVLFKRVEKLEVAEAAQDRPNQEQVKLDLRISGPLLNLDGVPEDQLLAQVTKSLGECIGVNGDLGISGVRIHRVKAPRGNRNSKGTGPSASPAAQIIVTCKSLAAKKKILQNKRKSDKEIRIASELTPWQVRQKSSLWERFSALKDEGKNAFFLGHRLFLQEGEEGERREILQ